MSINNFLVKRDRQITETFVELRVSRLVANVLSFLAVISLAVGIHFYNLGQKSLVAENAELVHNMSVVQKKYDALVLAKPMDPVAACPAWFAGTKDLKSTRKRLCEGK